jgi:hypothetical protein
VFWRGVGSPFPKRLAAREVQFRSRLGGLMWTFYFALLVFVCWHLDHSQAYEQATKGSER